MDKKSPLKRGSKAAAINQKEVRGRELWVKAGDTQYNLKDVNLGQSNNKGPTPDLQIPPQVQVRNIDHTQAVSIEFS